MEGYKNVSTETAKDRYDKIVEDYKRVENHKQVILGIVNGMNITELEFLLKIVNNLNDYQAIFKTLKNVLDDDDKR